MGGTKVYVMSGQICQYKLKAYTPSQPVMRAATSKEDKVTDE